MSFTPITLNQGSTYECLICLNKISQSQKPVAHPDKDFHKGSAHPFHPDCIREWLAASVNNAKSKCPACSFIVDVPTNLVNPVGAVRAAQTVIVSNIEMSLAIQEGNLDRVNALLASGVMSEENHGWAVSLAAEHGKREIVNALLVNGGYISEEMRGEAVWRAAKGGHREIVNILLASRPIPIPNRCREEAIAHAAARGHLEIVNALLANGAISNQSREDAIALAQFGGHREIVNALRVRTCVIQ